MKIRGFEVVKDEKRKTEGKVILPTRGTSKSMAYDFYSNVDITIKSAFTALFKFAVFKNGAEDGIRTHAYRNHNPRS